MCFTKGMIEKCCLWVNWPAGLVLSLDVMDCSFTPSMLWLDGFVTVDVLAWG